MKILSINVDDLILKVSLGGGGGLGNLRWVPQAPLPRHFGILKPNQLTPLLGDELGEGYGCQVPKMHGMPPVGHGGIFK